MTAAAHKITGPARDASAANSREQPPRAQPALKLLSAELRQYGHRLVELRADSRAGAARGREALELGYTLRYISSSLAHAPCRTCTLAGHEDCPLVRLWRRTRWRIDALEQGAQRPADDFPIE